MYKIARYNINDNETTNSYQCTHTFNYYYLINIGSMVNIKIVVWRVFI